MDSSAFLFIVLVGSTGMLRQVWGMETVIGLYGETIVVPCNDETPPGDKLMFTKWKYEQDDGKAGYLMLKHAAKSEAIVQATDSYATRVDMADNSSLLISQGTLKDQRIYTCMVVSESNLREYPITVVVYKKPESPEIMDKAKMLEKDKLTMLGTCVSKDANPAAEITWQKNGQPLVADGKAIIVSSTVKEDPATGLSTTSSSLQYTATKGDLGARFSCMAKHKLGPVESEPQTIPVHYPTEKVSLTVQPEGPIAEGGNVTLKCHADGNPPPSSYNFHIKGQTVLVENSDSYTVTAITRDSAGEYKCSLVDNEKMEASQSIAVSYLDLSLSPSGKVLKKVKDPLVVKMDKNASGDAKVTWTKDGEKTEAPVFGKLTYAHAGMYVCEVSMAGLMRRQSFELVVEGKPVITGLIKQRAEDAQHKVLACEAEAVPEPVFSWNVNSTNEETSYNEKNGKAIHKITVEPRANLTVTCSVSNKLGDDAKTINVSSLFKEEVKPKSEGKSGTSDDSGDQAKLIVGIVVGLIIAALVVALVYWLYMKRRQGTWKTGEKETGTSEESKKLEENNHTV